ncbi:hypothetical protein CDV55_101226 [Aspergillus turcosus]|nr:hypothetical protein CDV55_101226 [Aspergillus turcosus]
MTDEQLSVAVERDQLSQPRYSPCQRSGKNDAQYWRRYPLRTARDLRKWQLDCSAETRVSPSRRTEVSAQSEAEADENSPLASEGQQTELQPVSRFEQVTSAQEVGLISTQVTHGKGMDQSVGWKSPTTRGYIYMPSSFESTQLQDTATLHAGTPPGPSLWGEAPSVAFQRQFLW